ncbi:MAG: FAD-dependent oxidoreductase, partial [Anaerolineales bacterium]
MESQSVANYSIAIVGAGPAGLYAARILAEQGALVVLFNRDIKPGGLAEYGIYFDKVKMKEGLRKQFQQILDMPNVHYFGNVVVGKEADISLDEIKSMGFDAILVTAGAQGTKWLGIPGENIPKGVYHAKDIVYYYNKLPPFSQR